LLISDDRNRMNSLLRCDVRVRLYDVEDADDRLLIAYYITKQHVLHQLLPERHNANYIILDHSTMTALCEQIQTD